MSLCRYAIYITLACSSCVFASEPLNVLIIDGQNNHNWQETTPALKRILNSCGRFKVDCTTTPPASPKPPTPPAANASARQLRVFEDAKEQWDREGVKLLSEHAELWEKWNPQFKDYDVVVSNYNGEPWSEKVRTAFVEFVANGGGFVSVHAADNAFPHWKEYNEMIGVGGWGKRSDSDGVRIRVFQNVVKLDQTPGRAGYHGKRAEFTVHTANATHPIMKGLPERWRHSIDELYSGLRGPAKNVEVLASASNSPTQPHEPILMAITYGKGRIFHTTLGHSAASMSGLGFQVTLQRGAEWAASGQVTLFAPNAGELSETQAATRALNTQEQ